jgi:hypothetical protein
MQKEDYSFPTLDQVVDQHLGGFTLEDLLNEPVESVRKSLWWWLVEYKKMSPVQFMVVWCEYAREKDFDPSDYFFGLSNKEALAELSKEELECFSRQGLKSDIDQHLRILYEWEEACHKVTGTDDDAINDKTTEGEDNESRVDNETNEPESPQPQKKKRVQGRQRKKPLVEEMNGPKSPQQVSVPERRTRGGAKPRRRFDPCAGDGRHWSEPGQPKQVTTTPPRKKRKKTTDRMFDIEKRGTTLGEYKPKSLWKYVAKEEGNRVYIVEIANGKPISKKHTIQVTFRGYGAKPHAVPVASLQVPSDDDFTTFETSYRCALEAAQCKAASK